MFHVLERRVPLGIRAVDQLESGPAGRALVVHRVFFPVRFMLRERGGKPEPQNRFLIQVITYRSIDISIHFFFECAEESKIVEETNTPTYLEMNILIVEQHLLRWEMVQLLSCFHLHQVLRLRGEVPYQSCSK